MALRETFFFLLLGKLILFNKMIIISILLGRFVPFYSYSLIVVLTEKIPCTLPSRYPSSAPSPSHTQPLRNICFQLINLFSPRCKFLTLGKKEYCTSLASLRMLGAIRMALLIEGCIHVTWKAIPIGQQQVATLARNKHFS